MDGTRTKLAEKKKKKKRKKNERRQSHKASSTGIANNTKLVAHHCGVDNYLISLPLLQYFIEQGVEVSVIHKVIKFRQGYYLMHFIDKNIRMRAAATNPFIKNALKLMNNAIYGRTLLNPLNYATEAKMCHDENFKYVKILQ